jgi:predicted secreted protein
MKNQKGFAHILMVGILLAGLVAGVYLVGQQTNLFPKAYFRAFTSGPITPTPTSISAPITPTPSACTACGADINKDGYVTILDFSLLRSCFGQTVSSNPKCITSDLNSDGKVDLSDFGCLKDQFGKQCIKENLLTVDKTWNGKSISIKKGSLIKVSLSNPGDGGYKFAEPQVDKLVLRQTGYQHFSPTSGLAGDFGYDEWTFQALKIGSTKLTYEIYRPWVPRDHVKYFEITLKVN